jgi:methylamine dehydrogenase accessory protein MauD
MALWALVLFLGFLLIGLLRNVGLLTWRLEQLEATTPSRLGRNGLKPGKKAPDFTLASTERNEISLHDYLGRTVLLVFVQDRCGPCHEIVPELNKLAGQDRDLEVLAINHASPEGAREWAAETAAHFPVLIQEDLAVSKRYEVFATPFAFLIDEQGVVKAKGIVGQRHHFGYLLSSAAPQKNRYAGDELLSGVAKQFSGDRPDVRPAHDDTKLEEAPCSTLRVDES